MNGHPQVPPQIEVLLDGAVIVLPPDRQSLCAVKAYLETLALAQQRILSKVIVDGPHEQSDAAHLPANLVRVEATTIDLNQMPEQILTAAIEQAGGALERIEHTINLICINRGRVAQELWWNIAPSLKEPLISLSLLPPSFFGPAYAGASPAQLRRWQMEQLASIMREVDTASADPDSGALAQALETLVVPWLQGLLGLLDLIHEIHVASQLTAAHPA